MMKDGLLWKHTQLTRRKAQFSEILCLEKQTWNLLPTPLPQSTSSVNAIDEHKAFPNFANL
ncbi:MAG: hypothetical protein ACJ8CB_31905 [Ktedonobacteraceae bacterium]